MSGHYKILLGFIVSLMLIAFFYYSFPYFLGRYQRLLLARRAKRKRALVLTFDDGPGSRLTPAMLNILAKYKVKATFFLLGKNIIGREHIVRRIAAEGHEICSHGYDHLNYQKVSPIRALSDIKLGWQAIDSALNHSNRVYPFRPPHGRLNGICLLYLWIRRVPILYWTLDLGDTRSTLEQRNRQKTKALEKLRETGVLLAHDFDRSDNEADGTVLESIPQILKITQTEGLQIIPMSGLLYRAKFSSCIGS